jgi:hypothetical protein
VCLCESANINTTKENKEFAVEATNKFITRNWNILLHIYLLLGGDSVNAEVGKMSRYVTRTTFAMERAQLTRAR